MDTLILTDNPNVKRQGVTYVVTDLSAACIAFARAMREHHKRVLRML
jgi:hypothetical protein